MTSDSNLFLTKEQLVDKGHRRINNSYTHENNYYLPLYEAKLAHQYQHRSATFEGVPEEDRFKTHAWANEATLEDLKNPEFSIIPRYWVDEKEVEQKAIGTKWFLTFRNAISAVADSRSLVATIIPRAVVGNSMPVVFTDQEASKTSCLFGSINSFILDFVLRQKASGGNLNFYVFKQLPVIPPYTYTQALLDLIVPRVLELSYTAWDLQPFAQDVGYQGAPFIWDEERRFLMRCELDALYFHLYQINRDDVDYIMETFPIVKRKDIAATADENGEGGEYVTKNVILEMYDQMGQLPSMAVPAPKDENSTYDVPDVSQWQTWLNPPPADESVAHEDIRG